MGALYITQYAARGADGDGLILAVKRGKVLYPKLLFEQAHRFLLVKFQNGPRFQALEAAQDIR